MSNQEPEKAIEQLREKLRELFQLDRGDLDFGIYQVMNVKNAETTKFLDEQLLPQVSEALGAIATHDVESLMKQRADASDKARELGLPPEDSPKIKELDKMIEAAKADSRTEVDTYNHLYSFFSRYYDQGDFISKRRYKNKGKESYALPYNGEEVLLHWANSDQYYVKTTENYSSYAFIVNRDGNPARVRFAIAEADTERDNVQERNGNGRYFILSDKPVQDDGDSLVISFCHRPLTAQEQAGYPQNAANRQQAINEKARESILQHLNDSWKKALSLPDPTPTNLVRSVLDKHLCTYTAKNCFDYFIHKDLKKFLTQELDHYLKSEVISLDNLEMTDDASKFIRGLAQIKAIRLVGHKIIDFLAQIEDFQKQLWLKKKFVLRTEYLITLDKVPSMFFDEITNNQAQHDEWVRLFAIDDLKGEITGTDYSNPLKVDFLEENPNLVLDTKHFGQDFVNRLLESLCDASPLEDQIDGLLIHGENYQVLNLLQIKYNRQFSCVYIDPPYNTASSAILYKNDYKDSSWLSLMSDRLRLARELLSSSGVLCCAIDDEEAWRLQSILQNIFEHELGVAPVRTNPVSRKSSGKLSPTHEYALFFGGMSSKPGMLPKTEKQLKRYKDVDEKGRFTWVPLIRSGSNDLRDDAPRMYYPIYVNHDDDLRIPDMEWDDDRREYNVLEQPHSNEVVVLPIRDGIEKNWQRGFKRIAEGPPDGYRVKRNGTKEISIDFKAHMDTDASPNTWWDDNRYASANHGPKELKELFGQKQFDYPKSVELVEDCLRVSGCNDTNAYVLDFFAGSGTTAQAVINLNREDNGKRKYVLVEVGYHFDDVLLPRVKKVIYSNDWKDGKPQCIKGMSQMCKYVRLESYEDTLDSLQVTPRDDIFSGVDNQSFVEEYKLRYALGAETCDSATLVGQDFIDPFNYTLSVVHDGMRQDVVVDMVETFNLLLGLRVCGRKQVDGVLTITGNDANNQNLLVIWRNTKTMSAAKLDEWFTKNRAQFDESLNMVYVNGDHNLNAMRQEGDQWKAIVTEPVFRKLMFGTHA